MAENTTKKASAKKAEKTLIEQLADVRKDLLEAQKSHRSGELVNPRIVSVYRKDIARLMTKISAERSAEKEGK